MNEDYDRIKLRYEKSLEIRYHEVNLLFQRFNFFIVGMSFLVAALATILASIQHKDLQWISDAIMVLGLILSIGFALINYLAARTVKQLDDNYLNIAENAILNNDGPFNKSRDYATDRCSIKHIDKKFRVLHTWIIPLLFICFWIVMMAKYWNY